MAKLHELLAVVGNLENQAVTTRDGLAGTFENKKHLFEETLKTVTPVGEDAKTVVESQKDIQSTVRSEIGWLIPVLAKAMDINFQVDVANTQARADIVLENGQVLISDVPSTYLLQLAKRLEEVRGFALKIPTLDPAKGFTLDPHREGGIYQARVRNNRKTEKRQRPIVLYDATDKHPAQVQLISEDVVIAHTQEQEWSSMTTPAIKSDILSNVDVLIRAVKKARAKANEQEVDVAGLQIGRRLLDFVFEPLLQG